MAWKWSFKIPQYDFNIILLIFTRSIPLLSYSLKLLVEDLLGQFGELSPGGLVPLLGLGQVGDHLVLSALHLINPLAFTLSNHTVPQRPLLLDLLLCELGHPFLERLQLLPLLLLLLPGASVQTDHAQTLLLGVALFPRAAGDIAALGFLLALLLNLDGFEVFPELRVLGLS